MIRLFVVKVWYVKIYGNFWFNVESDNVFSDFLEECWNVWFDVRLVFVLLLDY